MATNTLACVVIRGMVISLENISQIQSISVTFRYNGLLEDWWCLGYSTFYS
jgi:hypothetical protein